MCMDDEFTSEKRHDSEIVSDMLTSIKMGIDAVETWQETRDSSEVEVELMMFGDVADRLSEPYEHSTKVSDGDGESSGESCGEAIFGDAADEIILNLESISDFIEENVFKDSSTVSDEEIEDLIEDASEIGNEMNMAIRSD